MRLKKLLKNKFLYLCLFFFIIYICFAVNYNQYNDVWWDAASYIGMAKYIYSGGQEGMFEPMKPVILPVFLGIFYLLKLNIVFFGKMLIFFFSMLSLVTIYLFGKEIFGQRVGIISSILLFLNPLFFLFMFRIYTEMLSVFFILGALFFTYKFLKYSEYKFLIISAFFSILSFYSKYPYILLFVIVNIFLIVNSFKQRKFKPIILFNICFLFFFSPFLISNYVINEDALYLVHIAHNYFESNISQVYSLEAYPVPPLLFSISKFIYFKSFVYLFNILLPFLFLGIYLFIKNCKSEERFARISLIIFPALVFFVFFEIFHLKQERYILPVFSILTIPLGFALSKLRIKWIAFIIIIYALITFFWIGTYMGNNDIDYASFFSNPPIDLNCEKVVSADPRSILKYNSVIFPYEVFDESWNLEREPKNILNEKPDCVFYFSCVKNRGEHFKILENIKYNQVFFRDTGKCSYAIYYHKA